MAIQFELYKSPNPKDEEDKELYHARVVNFQHIDTDYLAKEIQQDYYWEIGRAHV